MRPTKKRLLLCSAALAAALGLAPAADAAEGLDLCIKRSRTKRELAREEEKLALRRAGIDPTRPVASALAAPVLLQQSLRALMQHGRGAATSALTSVLHLDRLARAAMRGTRSGVGVRGGSLGVVGGAARLGGGAGGNNRVDLLTGRARYVRPRARVSHVRTTRTTCDSAFAVRARALLKRLASVCAGAAAATRSPRPAEAEVALRWSESGQLAARYTKTRADAAFLTCLNNRINAAFGLRRASACELDVAFRLTR